MTRTSWISATSALLLSVFATAAWASDEIPAVTHDGLELVKNGRLDMVYRRPGADFSGYRKLVLDPFEVAFKKEWTRDFQRVTKGERERIRRELAELARDVFVKELQEKGGYQVVDAPGPDVLRVSAAIIELYINAPDTMQPGRNRTYTLATGEATLVAELRDSESGAVLARVADRERTRESATLQWASRSKNRRDAEEVLGKWCRALRDGLDAAKSGK